MTTTANFHEMKTISPYFEDARDGRKNFEVRRDDRGGFVVGDVLVLRLYRSGVGFIDDEPPLLRQVTYVLADCPDSFGVADGFAVLGVRPVTLTLTAPSDEFSS